VATNFSSSFLLLANLPAGVTAREFLELIDRLA
jgi:hypothetical protein